MIEKENKLYYLAHPYASDPLLNTFTITRIAAILVSKGYNIYSPITHTHHIDVQLKYMDKTITNEQWVDYDMIILSKCDAIIMAGDWRDSKGCMREVELMEISNKPLFYYNSAIQDIISFDWEVLLNHIPLGVD